MKKITLFAVLLFTSSLFANTNLPKKGTPVVTSFHEDDNRFNSIKIEALSNSGMGELEEVFFEISKLKKLFPAVDEIRVLSENNNEKTLHLSFDFPFPMKDRCITLVVKKDEVSANKTIINITQLKSDKTKNCKKVQFEALDCEITIEKKGEDVIVSQSLYLDPGGKMPVNMFNNKLKKMLPELFANLI